MPVRVTVINDYLVVVAGVNAILSEYADRIEVVEKRTVSKGAAPVDVALYDTFAAPVGKHARLAALCQDPSIAAVAVYSFAADRAAVEDSLALGANGFLSKSLSAPELVRGIEEIAAGRIVTMVGPGLSATGANDWPAKEAGLSAREAEMVGLIVQGMSNHDIADRCYLSANTVKTYIRAAYRKMGVTTRAQAVAWGIEHGLKPDRQA
ncbi:MULTISPECIES: response regulator transcription factor [unclassified Dietzia]|uniref:response regulator transcription factor n=1 Tax=unclassified Dietzia TaxID=2617939 RepID=UPI0015FB16B6|nr:MULTISPECIES: response regulator transcription factor [unclassified Dietzia]MBB1055168.1 response regulator transcription factor [Dietzia sp. B44]MBB1056371.1 response regulator transcription factor [Dietzia sp. B19]MDZ4232970.1 response regulator transcription factor [Dietzia sp.]